jgi:8-amino-7-oxononanoate synthase
MSEPRAGDAFLKLRLEERASKGLLRKLVLAEGKVDFSSNDYLGFARLPELRAHTGSHDRAGATGSRLISGNAAEAISAEKTVAAFHGTEAALIFNCGYMANVGLLSAIATRTDTFIVDEYVHASILDGIAMSPATKFRFQHNDVAALTQKLARAQGNIFVVVESLYSMDGDTAPLLEMAEVCAQYGAHLIVDEAHALGVCGGDGQGLVGEFQLQDRVFACVYTYGKALGLHGAAVVGSQTLIDYLINFARSFVYSTAMPPAAYAHIEAAYRRLPSAPRERLFGLVVAFRAAARQLPGWAFLDSHSQIQGLLVGDNALATALSAHLWDAGIYAKAILSPTVPVGTERLRICLHAHNTLQEIDQLFAALNLFRA